MTTFVTVGNARQPFRRLLDAVVAHISLLPPPVVVQHGHTPFAAARCRAVEFMSMQEYADHIARARIVIMHAGAGSLIHALETGKRPIVMPRRKRSGEHVNDHQVELAEALAAQGKVVLIESSEDLAVAVRAALAVEPHTHAQRDEGSEARMVGLLRNVLAEFARMEKR